MSRKTTDQVKFQSLTSLRTSSLVRVTLLDAIFREFVKPSPQGDRVDGSLGTLHRLHALYYRYEQLVEILVYDNQKHTAHIIE